MHRELEELRRAYPGATDEQLQPIAKILINSMRMPFDSSDVLLYEARK